jgi:inward rectifier potassium channel
VMIVESITGIIFTAVVTGLVFAKFSRTTGRIAFSNSAVICTHDGKPTLMFRVGNQRSNVIVEATIHVVASFTHTTAEGSPFYKLVDLPLTRNRMGGMRRGWLVMHPIDEASPFHDITAEDAKRMEIELEISLLGFDDVTLQTVHAMHHYGDMHLKFGQKFADSLTILDNGDMMLDMTKFHATVPE